MHMNGEIVEHLTDLLWTGVIALLVWAYYRDRTSPALDKYSTFAPRFLSGFVDSCVLWPIGFLSAIVLSFQVPRSLAALVVIAESVTWLVYTAQMHALYGQTIGKMVTKVRVVDFRTEERISLWQAWLREGIPVVLGLGLLGYQVVVIVTSEVEPNLIASGKAFSNDNTFWLLTALPGLWFLAEVLTMLTNDKRRALHDFIAGTVVIRTNTKLETAQQGTPEDVGADAPPPLS